MFRVLVVTSTLLALCACDDLPIAGDPRPAPDVDCDALCARCDDGECRAVCLALTDALQPGHATDWAECMAFDPCAIDQPRACIDGLECADPVMIGAHCDVLARCGSDGRGMLDEEHCRAHPYHEASRWSCLKPDRAEAVQQCLSGAQCVDMAACLDNAVCLGDDMCGTLLSTALTVDCHRVCDASLWQCRQIGYDYGECWRGCERAARHLADEHRRTYEACALDGECRNPVTSRACLEMLECPLSRPLVLGSQSAAQRCGTDWDESLPVAAWSCLGAVHIDALYACLDRPDCLDIEACLVDATACADDPECLSFIGGRVMPSDGMGGQ